MENDPVWNKIARKLAGESRSDEELAVKEWANRDKLNQGILSRLIEIWEYNPAGSSKSPRIYRAYKNRLNYHEKKHNENLFIFYGWRSSITQIYNNLIKICSCLLIYKQLKINNYAGAKDKLRKNYQLID